MIVVTPCLGGKEIQPIEIFRGEIGHVLVGTTMAAPRMKLIIIAKPNIKENIGVFSHSLEQPPVIHRIGERQIVLYNVQEFSLNVIL